MLLLGLSLSKLFFDLPLPQEIITKMGNDPEIEGLTRKVIAMHYSGEEQASRSYSSFGILWQMRERSNDRLRFAYKGLFAPKFDDFKFVQLPKGLLYLYPLVRPIRLLVKYFHR